ncbi:MAG: hypothetical protein ABR927_15055 [Bacteroidales bacterium]
MTNPAHLSGPRYLDSFIVTPNARPSIGPDSYRDCKNKSNSDTDGNKLNRRTDSGNISKLKVIDLELNWFLRQVSKCPDIQT